MSLNPKIISILNNRTFLYFETILCTVWNAEIYIDMTTYPKTTLLLGPQMIGNLK